MRALERWKSLDSFDRRAIFSAGWRLVFVRISLALLGVQRTQRQFGRLASAGELKLELAEPWHRRALALRRVGGRIPGARCLARAMVLWWWMRTEGFDPKLCMGVRSGVGAIEGHAWIECDGHTIDEAADVAATYQDLAWRSPR